MASLNSFNACQTLVVGNRSYQYFSLKAAEENGLRDVSRLPYSLKVVLENLLRNEDGRSVTRESIESFAKWLEEKGKTEREIAFRPARVLMQDFTGVPAVVDLAAMRDAVVALGGTALWTYATFGSNGVLRFDAGTITPSRGFPPSLTCPTNRMPMRRPCASAR